jgi:hypothetical protein
MFILEPFIKHEEEQQAYARLHRYGQEGSGVQDLLHARFCGSLVSWNGESERQAGRRR